MHPELSTAEESDVTVTLLVLRLAHVKVEARAYSKALCDATIKNPKMMRSFRELVALIDIPFIAFERILRYSCNTVGSTINGKGAKESMKHQTTTTATKSNSIHSTLG